MIDLCFRCRRGGSLFIFPEVPNKVPIIMNPLTLDTNMHILLNVISIILMILVERVCSNIKTCHVWSSDNVMRNFMLHRLSSSWEKFFSFLMRHERSSFFKADHAYVARGKFLWGFCRLQKLSSETCALHRRFSPQFILCQNPMWQQVKYS